MYNMLNGIRVSVSRCQAKLKRTLTDDDFTAAHKFSFDTIGNELTPSAKYDFKFKDYAPWVFRSLREEHFALDPADYLVSLTGKYILSEVGSPGKSGSFFYYSRDYRFIIKTIHHAEHKFLRKILPQYYAHIASNPHTLLSRFYGLHRVKLPHGRKIHFVVMNNLFPAHLDIHETYDLKGSTVGREYDEAKARENQGAVLKDVNWIHRHKQLEFGPEKRAFLQAQLERDKQFLQTVGVMDYSLLVGIHNVKRGNRDNLRRNTLKVFSPTPRRQPSKAKTAKYEIQTTGTELAEQDLPIAHPEQQARFIFYADDGGYRATGEDNRPMGTVYYLGVIDILTPWNTKKKLEGLWKGLSADRHKISPVHSHEYGERFFSFLKAVMRGGEGGETFLPKEDREKDEKGKGREETEEEKPNGEPRAES
ncbi:1-phosphatidylinositol-4-phosphate 5-kinase its3, partial [Rhizoctonia solani AG-3 Rhs1AP]